MLVLFCIRVVLKISKLSSVSNDSSHYFREMSMWLFIISAILVVATLGRDISLQQYSDKGELLQLTYAGRAVQRSSPLIAFTSTIPRSKGGDSNCTVLMCMRRESVMQRSDNPESSVISRIESFVFTSAGYSPDCKSALAEAADVIYRHKQVFGESPSMDKLSGVLGRWITRGLHRIGDKENSISRPLATTLVICGLEKEYSGRILLLENTGSYTMSKNLISLGNMKTKFTQETFCGILNESLEMKVKRIASVLFDEDEGYEGGVFLDIAVIIYDEEGDNGRLYSKSSLVDDIDAGQFMRTICDNLI
jgi:20S proteasome alpha/beta subunit